MAVHRGEKASGVCAIALVHTYGLYAVTKPLRIIGTFAREENFIHGIDLAI